MQCYNVLIIENVFMLLTAIRGCQWSKTLSDVDIFLMPKSITHMEINEYSIRIVVVYSRLVYLFKVLKIS